MIKTTHFTCDVRSREKITPLLVSMLLMFAPGIFGLMAGWVIAPRFLENDEEFPFPGVIQAKIMAQVFASRTETVTSNRNVFLKWAFIGFLISLMTTLFLPVVDFSSNRLIVGLILGISGILFFVAGFIVKKPTLTVLPLIMAILFYIIMPMLLLPSNFPQGSNFIETHGTIMSSLYLSSMIGVGVGSLFFGSFIHPRLKKLIFKSRIHQENDQANEDQKEPNNVENDKRLISLNEKDSFWTEMRIFFKKNLRVLLIGTFLYLLTIAYVSYFNIFPVSFLIIGMMLFWILIIGNLVNGYVAAQGLARTSSYTTIPFIFNYIPIYLAGGRSITSYVATPQMEELEIVSLLNSMKMAEFFQIKRRQALSSFLLGYFPAMISSLFFSIFLWYTLGIGSVEFPAPTFPFIASLMASFASENPLTFLHIDQLLISLVLSILIGPSYGLAILFGMIFPFHLLLPLTLGSVIRMLLDKKYDPKVVQQKGFLRATALSAGAAMSIIPLILLALI